MGKRSSKNKIEDIIALISSLSKEDKEKILLRIQDSKDKIPISAFKANLSCLEIVIKYLKEDNKKTCREISILLNRKLSTIYNTYNNSKAKLKQRLDTTDISIVIPIRIFQDRNFSMLESISAYLKDNKSLSIEEISTHLNRNYNTIKTVYRRYRKKKILVEQRK